MTEPASDPASDPAALERGRWLFTQVCEFVMGAREAQQLPLSEQPEIAFAGRSNVGKSSLVNALTQRKTLARTSNTPGRTREVNFFDLGGKLMLADLPGYGYARAAKTEIERWNQLIRDYLRGRVQLRRVFLLVDARHGLKPGDRQVMELLDTSAVIYQIVLTKADKVKAQALQETLARIKEEAARHGAAHPDILVTSAQKGQGLAELRAAAAALVEWS